MLWPAMARLTLLVEPDEFKNTARSFKNCFGIEVELEQTVYIPGKPVGHFHNGLKKRCHC